jgi:hypothetical protein
MDRAGSGPGAAPGDVKGGCLRVAFVKWAHFVRRQEAKADFLKAYSRYNDNYGDSGLRPE